MSEKNVIIFAVIITAIVATLFISHFVFGFLAFEIAFLIAILIGIPGMLGVSIYFTYKASVRLKMSEQERGEFAIREIEKIGEKVLGCIKVERPKSFLRPGEFAGEVLVVTRDKVLVERIAEVSPSFSVPIIDWAEARHVIPESDTIEVELKKFFRTIKLKIVTHEEQHKWFVRGMIPEKKKVRVEEYESLLRSVFGDKLIVKK